MSNQIFNLVDKVDSSLAPFYHKKIPSLPKNISELIVKYGPYLILFGIASYLISLLNLMEIRSFGYRVFSPFISTARLGFPYFVIFVISALNIIVMIYALPGLFSRKLRSWKLLYFSVLLSLLQVITFRNILAPFISAFISFYFLYQIKSFYR
jgi:hypothetical protein